MIAAKPSIGLQNRLVEYGNAPSDDWPTYHRDMFRSGYDPAFAPFSSAILHWRSSSLDGDVYAEPLIVGTTVIVGTEANSLYDLNATTGQIVWHINLGTPVNAGDLGCPGDINPSGITSTPVIDVNGRTIFVVAFLQAPSIHHELFAVDLDTGNIKFQLTIDPQSANFPVIYQQQRAALALSDGYVYVAYGGLDGDCGPYHGWLAATNTNGLGSVISYQVPTGREGAIWGGGDGPVVDQSGDVLVATGNSDATSTFDWGDAVLKLSPASNPPISLLDWFAPSNWATLNSQDLDLGSTEPMILSSTILFQIGKEGVGYLLNANNLGEYNSGAYGGQLYAHDVCNGGGAYGGLAYVSPYLVIPCDNGLVALQVNLTPTPSFSVAWNGPNYVAGPPIIAGDAVWDVDVSDGMIYAFNLTNGQTIFQDTIGSLPTHFNSLSAGDGQVFVAASRHVLAYLPEPLQLSVTPQTPPDGSDARGGYQVLVAKVTSPGAVPVEGANVTMYVNGTSICTNQMSSSTGLVTCPFEVFSAGTYYWNETAQKTGFDSAVSPQTTFAFTAGPVVYQIPLVAGWNLISTPIIPSSTSLSSVLASQIAGGNFTVIWSYQNGKWFEASLSGGKLSGTLTTFQDGYGYWIYMTKPDSVFVVGNIISPPPATPPSYSLTLGWNLVGFKPEPTIGDEPVGTYLSSITGQYYANSVLIYDNSAQSWIRADPSYMLQPGQAIWIMMNSPATLQP